MISLERFAFFPLRAPVALAVLALMIASSAARGQAASAADLQARFRDANAAYEEGNFARAIELYEEILISAPGDAVTEFNLGNAYARAGDIARAILHYERALRSNPRLQAARTNLRRIAPPANFPEASPLLAPLAWTRDQLALPAWLWVVFALLCATCLAGAARVWMRRPPLALRASVWIFAGLLAISALFAFASARERNDRAVIILSQGVIARSGPGPQYLEAMELPAGAKAHSAGEARGGWVKIRTLDGRTAFVQISDLEWI